MEQEIALVEIPVKPGTEWLNAAGDAVLSGQIIAVEHLPGDVLRWVVAPVSGVIVRSGGESIFIEPVR